MKERGLLFSAPMVRALLAGTKTQTRRTMKLREFGPSTTRGYDWCFRDRRALWNDVSTELLLSKFCPYGPVGRRLWVRETFALIWPGEGPPANLRDHHVEYRADCLNKFPGQWPDDFADDAERPRWKPSIFMPRWASRITLEVTEVRVERLQDISEEDARAEGVKPTVCGDTWLCVTEDGRTFDVFVEPDEELRRDEKLILVKHRPAAEIFSARQNYRMLWNQINGAGSWEINPFVWAIAFRRTQP